MPVVTIDVLGSTVLRQQLICETHNTDQQTPFGVDRAERGPQRLGEAPTPPAAARPGPRGGGGGGGVDRRQDDAAERRGAATAKAEAELRVYARKMLQF
jgi:hypothetical protein